ncbi:MAG TPA: hypothetical protein VI814_07950 [Candidatus Limnocylindria bacterium]
MPDGQSVGQEGDHVMHLVTGLVPRSAQLRYVIVAILAFVLGSATVVEAAPAIASFHLADGTDPTRLAAVDANGNQQVNVNNFPTTQAVSGTVSVGNLPATQAVSGTVSVSNLPATQAVTGTVNVGNQPSTSVIGLSDTNVADGSIGTLSVPTSQYGQVRVGVAVACTAGQSITVFVSSDGNSATSFLLGQGQAKCNADEYFEVFEMPGVHMFVQAFNYTGGTARIIIVAMGR